MFAQRLNYSIGPTSAGTEASALTAGTRLERRAAATSAAAEDISRETAAAAGRALARDREGVAADRGQPAPTLAAHRAEAEDITREATLQREAETAAGAEATAAVTPAPTQEPTQDPSPPRSRPPRATPTRSAPTE